MDEQKNPDNNNNRKLHVVYLLIIFILGGLCVYLVNQVHGLKTQIVEHTTTINQVIQERDDVKADLEDLKTEYEQLQTTDAGLNAELTAKKAYIDSLLVEADKHKGDAAIIAKLKKETQTLRRIMQGYIVTIDSLNTLNNTLRAEKQEVLTQLDQEKTKVGDVTKEKEGLQSRIDQAALLTTLNIRATGVNETRGGKKESETNKASKADKIKVSFDIADNDLTKTGAHTIYLRVMTPDGRELTKSEDPDHQFSWGAGNKGFFAAKKTIDYQNQPMSVLMYCEKPNPDNDFLPGNYRIEIVCDNAIIGETSFTLQ
jgi:hypothetical protein